MFVPMPCQFIPSRLPFPNFIEKLCVTGIKSRCRGTLQVVPRKAVTVTRSQERPSQRS
jgi:hypothetical protein